MPITKTQLERRTAHIGSSDMAAILGLDPFRNAYDVYLEKTDKLEPLVETEVMQAGSMFEDGVLQFAETKLGKLIRNQYRSAKDRGIPLGANIDALVSGNGNPVEAKTAGLFGPLMEVWGAQDTDEVPDRVIIQAHVHMLCADKDVCHIAAFLGGRGFQMFEIPKDNTVADVVTETAIQFWTENVLGDTPPDKTLPQAKTIKRIKREPETVIELNGELVDAWLQAKDQVKAAEEVKGNAEVAMLTALGQADGGRTASGLLTYMQQTRTSVDSSALKVDQPDIYHKYAKLSTFRVARFKANKEK